MTHSWKAGAEVFVKLIRVIRLRDASPRGNENVGKMAKRENRWNLPKRKRQALYRCETVRHLESLWQLTMI